MEKPSITPAEKRIAKRLFMSNKEIAEELCLSIHTVKTHIHHLMVKFKAKTRTELLLKVIK